MLRLRLLCRLAALGALGLSGCFSASEKTPEEPVTLPFSKPKLTDFVGEYRLTQQHVVDTLAIARLRTSRLVFRRDHTFQFKDYPCFTDRPASGWTLDSLADFTGTWSFVQNTSAFNEATQTRQESWSCQFSPEPEPKNRTAEEKSRQTLGAEPYVDKKTGRLTYFYLYIGDLDSNDYLMYEPVAAK